jgi:phage repressor protein C with HTH and peptisase S24 domain
MGGFPDRMFTDEGRSTNGHDEYAEVMSADKSAFVARVDGDSMYPRFMNGDYALVEPNTEPELEDDVLLKLSSGEVMLKRLLSRKNGILLGSYNEPQTYRYNEEEIVWMYYVAHPVPARKIKSRV